MTREEAIKGLKSLVKVRREYFDMQTMGDEIEALEMAIKALEHPEKNVIAVVPCGDAISRQEALDALHVEGRPTKRFDYVIEVRRDIEALPTVTIQPKTGEWIDDKCAACGKGIEDLIESSEWYRNESPKYCPFCGIKIAEVEDGNVGN